MDFNAITRDLRRREASYEDVAAVAATDRPRSMAFDRRAPEEIPYFQGVGDPHSVSTERSQRRAAKAARSEIRSGLKQFKRAGLLSEFEEELEAQEPQALSMEGAFAATQPLFDLLQIGQFTVTGAIDEMLRTNDAWSAFEQGAIEFSNALPFYEDERARRLSFTNILQDHGGLNETAAQKGLAFGVGLALDIAMDPFFSPLKGVTKLNAFFSAVDKAHPLVLGANAGKLAAKTLGAAAGVNNAYDLAQAIPAFATLRKAFIPHSAIKDLAYDPAYPELTKEVIDELLKRMRGRNIAVDMGMARIDEEVSTMIATMTPEQRALMGYFADQGPETLEAVIRKLPEIGGDEEVVQVMMNKLGWLRGRWNKMADTEIMVGLLSPNVKRAHYMHGTAPVTEGSKRMHRHFSELMHPKVEILEDKLADEVTNIAKGITGDSLGAAKAKHHQSIAARVKAGLPTELDVGLVALKRGFDHVRATSTWELLDWMLDPATGIARALDPDDAAVLAGLAKSKKGLFSEAMEKSGYDIWHATKNEGGDAAYLLPKPILEELTKADDFFRNDSTLATFMRSMRTFQSAWKGYAVLSPGFHARNMYSNWFQNYLAGVPFNPKSYGRMMAIQAGGTEFLPKQIRGIVETALGGPKIAGDLEMVAKKRVDLGNGRFLEKGEALNGEEFRQLAMESGVLGTGGFAKDIFMDYERKVMQDAFLRGVEDTEELTHHARRFQTQLQTLPNFSERDAIVLAKFADLQALNWAKKPEVAGLQRDWWVQNFDEVVGDGIAGPESLFQQAIPRGMRYETTIPIADVTRSQKIGLSVVSTAAKEKLDYLDDVRKLIPNPLADEKSWGDFHSLLAADNVVIKPPYKVIEDYGASGGAARWAERRREIVQTNPEMIREADEGREIVGAIADSYRSGVAKPDDTAMMALWSAMSPQASPFEQEAMFLKALSRGSQEWIAKARTGVFEKWPWPSSKNQEFLNLYSPAGGGLLYDDAGRLLDVPVRDYQRIHGRPYKPATQKQLEKLYPKEFHPMVSKNPFLSWSTGILRQHQESVPLVMQNSVNTVMNNMNTFGKTFLMKMSQKAEGSSISRLEQLHDWLLDPQMTARQIRREFASLGDDLGVDNKLLSFLLLASGRDDTIILDRVMVRHLWDGRKRINEYNFRDKKGNLTDSIYEAGNVQAHLNGPRGIATYEAIEDSVMDNIMSGYDLAGISGGSLARFHWENWVAESSQSVGHRTLKAMPLIIGGAKRNAALRNVSLMQGKYDTWNYGVELFHNGKVFRNVSTDSKGVPYRFTNAAHGSFKAELQRQAKTKAVKIPANERIVPHGFLPTKTAAGNPRQQPWLADERVNVEALDALIHKRGIKLSGGELDAYRKATSSSRGTGGPGRPIEPDVPIAAGMPLNQLAKGQPQGYFRDVPMSKMVGGDDVPFSVHSGYSGVAKGAVEFGNHGRAMIRAFEDADVSTIIHELGHIHRRSLPVSDQARLEKAFNVKDGVWNRKAEERFARTFERVIREGKIPKSAAGRKIYSALKDDMVKTYKHIKGGDIDVPMSQDVRRFFDTAILGKRAAAKRPSVALIEKYEKQLRHAEDAGILNRQQVAGALRWAKAEERVGAVGAASGVKGWGGVMSGKIAKDSEELQNLIAKLPKGPKQAEQIKAANALLDAARGAKKETKWEMAKRYAGQQSPVLNFNRQIGTVIENNARLAHFAHKIFEKGVPAEIAANSVRKYLFDYSDLTPFERDFMKMLIPFYTWSRKNIPLQIQALISDPGKYAKFPKAIGAIEALSSEWEDLPTPDYFQEMHAVRLPVRIEGQPTYINPNLPWQDLNRMNFQDVLSGMSPFVKLFGEWAPKRGYSFFTDRPIERYPGEPAEVDVLGTGITLGRKKEEIARSLLPTYGKIQRLRTKVEREQTTQQLLTEVAGVKLMGLDVKRVKRSDTYKKRKLVRDLKDKWRAMGLIK